MSGHWDNSESHEGGVGFAHTSLILYSSYSHTSAGKVFFILAESWENLVCSEYYCEIRFVSLVGAYMEIL